MAKICEPFYGKKCSQFQGGQCVGDAYHLKYRVKGSNVDLGDLEWDHIFTNGQSFNNFRPISGQINCITEPFFPNSSDPFFTKYPVFSTTRRSLSIFVFNEDRSIPFQLDFPSFAFRSPRSAELVEVFNFTRMGIDPCGSFDPDSKDKCKCTEGDQEIRCINAKGGICCISKPKLTQLCRALK